MSAIRIHRYLAREISVPTILGLLVFTFVLFMGQTLRLVELIINKGIPVGEIARLFLCLLPNFLVITLPLAFLLGILIGFGRLSTDGEVIALKSCGLSLYQLVFPVFILAVLAGLFTAVLTLKVKPAANSAFRSQLFEMATSRASIGLQPHVFNDDFDGLVLYANEIDDRTGLMKGIFISDERIGASPSTIVAARGHIIRDRDALTLILRLEDGSIHRHPRRTGEDSYQVIDFSTYDINLNMGQDSSTTAGNRRIKESELTMEELGQARRNAATTAEQNKFTVEAQKRYAFPFAPLVFALVGVPLGIRSTRSGRGGGFPLALGIFLAYYVLLSFAETLAEKGVLPAVPTLWAPNLLFLCGGLYLLYRSAREKTFDFPERVITRIFRRMRRQGREK
jgi:lipopolysaccharide export system permease protein